MSEWIISAGMLLIFVGIALLIVGLILAALKQKQGQAKVEWGFGGFIGPFPFGFWSSQRMMWVVLVIMIIFISFFVLLNLIGK